MKFLTLKEQLQQREHNGLTRHQLTVEGPQQSRLIIDGSELVNFASNNYLGLANNEDGKAAIVNATSRYGFGSGASHLICGHQQPHNELETAVAEFLQRDAAIIFSSGYMANLAILQSLTKKGDLVITDKLNHASLIDGVKLSEADALRYAHCDLLALERRLRKASQNKFVVSDSVFSMDGDVAPLIQISELCEKYNAILIVDDAHGFGVLGEYGRGCSEYFGLGQHQLPVLMTTLGKALGGYGAVVSGEGELVDYLRQFARSYIYTTAMPASIAAANLANLKGIQDHPDRLRMLRQNIAIFTAECGQHGIPLLKSTTAIQPVLIGENQRVVAIEALLRRDGFLVGAVRPPTVPKGSARLRITISAAHSSDEIKQLIAALVKALSRFPGGS